MSSSVKNLCCGKVQYMFSAALLFVNVMLYISAMIFPVMHKYIGTIISLFIITFLVRGVMIIINEKHKKERKEEYVLSNGWLDLYGMPRKLRIVLLLSVGVAALSFIITTQIFLKDGGPEMIDGAYWIKNHGVMVREINQQEYMNLCKAETCFFVGHQLFFNGLFVAYFGTEYTCKS